MKCHKRSTTIEMTEVTGNNRKVDGKNNTNQLAQLYTLGAAAMDLLLALTVLVFGSGASCKLSDGKLPGLLGIYIGVLLSLY